MYPRTQNKAENRSSSQSERAEQSTLVAWADGTGLEVLRYLHASLAGEVMSTGQAIRAKKAGMRPGVPDMFLPVPVAGRHGLWIEIKTRTGRLSPDQERWHEFLTRHGYVVVVARSWGGAKEALVSYLRGVVE